MPKYKIACVESTSGLIVAQITIEHVTVSGILDTGATASFLPAHGTIMTVLNLKTTQIMAMAQTAGNSEIMLTRSVSAHVCLPSHVSDDNATRHEFFLLPNCSEILGQQVVIGLNLIRALDISFRNLDGEIRPFVHNKPIDRRGHYTNSPSVVVASCIAEQQANQMHNNATIQVTRSLDSAQIDARVHALKDQYAHIFAETVQSTIDMTPMTIHLAKESFPKARLRRHAAEDIVEIDKQVQRFLATDIIEPSNSQYSCNCHLVPKKDGRKRLVVNFIPLNRVTVKDHYPLPQIHDLFGALRGARYYCALDCTEGFFQVPIAEQDRPKTAFVTPQGLFQFKRCPFGFTNSPAVFQRAMNTIFGPALYQKCVVYVDDILVFGSTPEETLDNLEWVFARCKRFNVKLKLSKCSFMQTEVEFLGHKIAYNTLSPVAGKFDHLLEASPKSPIEVASILGTLNYYSRFIESYSEKTLPLRELTKKATSFVWTDDHKAIVTQLVDELATASMQTLPPSDTKKIIVLNVMRRSIEATCFTDDDKLISRTGRVLSSSEQNYTAAEKHLLCIIRAYERFGPVLRGEVVIKTSCKELKTAINAVERSERIDRLLLKLPVDCEFTFCITPIDKQVAQMKDSPDSIDEIFYVDGSCMGNGEEKGRAAWAVLAIKNQNLTVSGLVDRQRPTSQVAELTAIIRALEIAHREHMTSIVVISDSKYVVNAVNKWTDHWIENDWTNCRGKPLTNVVLLKELARLRDGLKLRCMHVKGHSGDIYNDQVDQLAYNTLRDSMPTCLAITDPIPVDQTTDPFIDDIMNKLPNDELLKRQYAIYDSMLYYIDQRLPQHKRYRLVVPKHLRLKLLMNAHDDQIFGGHYGVKKTKGKLQKYYWPSISHDIEDYVKTCPTCQRHKPGREKRAGLLQPMPVSKIFERLHVDVMGPYCETDKHNRYMITAVDALSRWAYAKAFPSVNTETIIEFLNDRIFAQHGLPSCIVSDNGSQFASRDFKTLMKQLDIRHILTTPYHPEANGRNERFNGTIKRLIKNYCASTQKDWDLHLRWMLFTYNISQNESTGFSPFQVLFGVEPRSPLRLANDPNYVQDTQDPMHDEVRQAVVCNCERAHKIQKRYYDANKVAESFELFDTVLIKRHSLPSNQGLSKKLAECWVGPFIIYRKVEHDGVVKSLELIDPVKNEIRRIPFKDVRKLKLRSSELTDVECDVSMPGDIIVQQDMRQDTRQDANNDDDSGFAFIPTGNSFSHEISVVAQEPAEAMRAPDAQTNVVTTEIRDVCDAVANEMRVPSGEVPLVRHDVTDKGEDVPLCHERCDESEQSTLDQCEVNVEAGAETHRSAETIRAETGHASEIAETCNVDNDAQGAQTTTITETCENPTATQLHELSSPPVTSVSEPCDVPAAATPSHEPAAESSIGSTADPGNLIIDESFVSRGSDTSCPPAHTSIECKTPDAPSSVCLDVTSDDRLQNLSINESPIVRKRVTFAQSTPIVGASASTLADTSILELSSILGADSPPSLDSRVETEAQETQSDVQDADENELAPPDLSVHDASTDAQIAPVEGRVDGHTSSREQEQGPQMQDMDTQEPRMRSPRRTRRTTRRPDRFTP